jgi:predicted deacetylase
MRARESAAPVNPTERRYKVSGGAGAKPEPLRRQPALLVSIHDVSPLTLALSRRAVELAESVGIPRSALTVLAIPRHEDRVPLDEHLPTRDWLHSLADAGVALAMHGFTHRMSGRVRDPWRWAWAQGFARGQGEFFLCDAGECERRLEAARGVFRRAGLETALAGFVPPAWLLSPGALLAVRRAGLTFYERLDGIVHRDWVSARRLIGFGSMNGLEAFLSAKYAWWQSHRVPIDTRFAIHPADLECPSSVRSIRLTLAHLLDGLEARNYADYLQHRA